MTQVDRETLCRVETIDRQIWYQHQADGVGQARFAMAGGSGFREEELSRQGLQQSGSLGANNRH